MKLREIGTVAAIAATVLAGGCKKADDEFAPAFVPKVYTFEGSADPRFIGKWKTSDGNSALDLQKDGHLEIETVTRSVNGKSVGHVSGNWLASGDSLMFRYAVGAQKPTVLKYDAALSGGALTLKQAAGRGKTTYKRS